MDFVDFHSEITSAMHGQNVCRAGYAALLRANDIFELTDVIRKYWADLNHDLWPVFQDLLHKHYAEYRDQFIQRGIHYNECASVGLCVIDGEAHEVITLSGKVDAMVHDNASVIAKGSADVTLLDGSHASASDMSRVSAWHHTSVHATGRSTIRAFDHSSVVADGAVTIHLADSARLTNLRSYRIYGSSTVICN